MMMVKKDIEILEEGEIFVYKHKGYIPEGDLGNHARNIQYVKVSNSGNELSVINFHGLWNGKGKGDTEDRILQTKNILDFIENLSHEIVLCGDFNLRPDTESIKLFEDAGMHNLIKEYGITSTRTSHYTKDEKFADYAFVSQGIKVKDFKILPDEVSDHAALYIEIEI
jgi:endonuclease/exonuclease/phosphatase family metal-dependent hydrolase